MVTGRVLVADDQSDVLNALKLLLGGEGYDVTTASSPRDLIATLEGADAQFLGEQGQMSQGTPRLAAYAYWKTKNPAFAKAATSSLLRFGGGPIQTTRIEGPLVLNPGEESPRIGTNGAAQSGLTAIEILELCADQLPTEVPPPQAFPSGRGNRGARPAPVAGGEGDVRNRTMPSDDDEAPTATQKK